MFVLNVVCDADDFTERSLSRNTSRRKQTDTRSRSDLFFAFCIVLSSSIRFESPFSAYRDLREESRLRAIDIMHKSGFGREKGEAVWIDTMYHRL